MTQYLMLNHSTAESTGWEEFFAMLKERNALLGGSAVDPVTALQDNTFIDPSTSSLDGYIVIQAENLDAAKSIMQQNPVHRSGGLVELFELYRTS